MTESEYFTLSRINQAVPWKLGLYSLSEATMPVTAVRLPTNNDDSRERRILNDVADSNER